MRLIDEKNQGLIFALFGILSLSACSGPTVDLDGAEHTRLLIDDRNAVGQGTQTKATANIPTQVIELSLAQAIQRGYTHNLDARVAALEELSAQRVVTVEQLKALPGVEASGAYLHRSNNGATSSRSVQTGQESLEPSQSTETDRRTAALEMNWNLLEAGLALVDAAKSKQDVKISKERYAKVIQNVERDVYNAYWRALAYQETKANTLALIRDVNAHIEKIDRAADKNLVSGDYAGEKMTLFSERLRTLRDMHDRLQLAEIELKSMLSIPLDATLKLTTKRADISPSIRQMMDENIATQEWGALQSRPEMREEILKKNITIHDTRREIFQTFPGIDLILSHQYDGNKFLADPNWGNFTAKIAQSITGIVTLPDRYYAAKSKEAIADARRQALSSAILAQVHIGRARLEAANDSNTQSLMALKASSRKSHTVTAKQSKGLVSVQDSLMARMDAQIEMMRSAMSYADLQNAYAAMRTTLGRNITNQSLKVGASSSHQPKKRGDG